MDTEQSLIIKALLQLSERNQTTAAPPAQQHAPAGYTKHPIFPGYTLDASPRYSQQGVKDLPGKPGAPAKGEPIANSTAHQQRQDNPPESYASAKKEKQAQMNKMIRSKLRYTR